LKADTQAANIEELMANIKELMAHRKEQVAINEEQVAINEDICRRLAVLERRQDLKDLREAIKAFEHGICLEVVGQVTAEVHTFTQLNKSPQAAPEEYLGAQTSTTDILGVVVAVKELGSTAVHDEIEIDDAQDFMEKCRLRLKEAHHGPVEEVAARLSDICARIASRLSGMGSGALSRPPMERRRLGLKT